MELSGPPSASRPSGSPAARVRPAAHDELAQVCVDIREVGNGGLRSMLDHEAGDTDVSGTVDGQRRSHATVVHEEGREVPRRRVSAYHHALGGIRKPDDLEIVLVLVGPHPRNLAEGLMPTQHVPGRGRALVLRVLPVLNPNPTAEEVVRMVSDVARGEHVVDRRLAVLVNDDPVPGGESRTPGERQIT